MDHKLQLKIINCLKERNFADGVFQAIEMVFDIQERNIMARFETHSDACDKCRKNETGDLYKIIDSFRKEVELNRAVDLLGVANLNTKLKKHDNIHHLVNDVPQSNEEFKAIHGRVQVLQDAILTHEREGHGEFRPQPKAKNTCDTGGPCDQLRRHEDVISELEEAIKNLRSEAHPPPGDPKPKTKCGPNKLDEEEVKFCRRILKMFNGEGIIRPLPKTLCGAGGPCAGLREMFGNGSVIGNGLGYALISRGMHADPIDFCPKCGVKL